MIVKSGLSESGAWGVGWLDPHRGFRFMFYPIDLFFCSKKAILQILPGTRNEA